MSCFVTWKLLINFVWQENENMELEELQMTLVEIPDDDGEKLCEGAALRDG